MKVIFIIATALAVVVPGHLALTLPKPRLPSPTGPFRVGFKDYFVTDQSRTELFNPPAKRKFAFTIFYPTLDIVTPNPYFTEPLAAAYEEWYNLPHTLATVLSNSKKNATPLPLPHPTLRRVLFSPGGGGSRLAHVALLEDLASHGYIVITIDHPYDSRLVVFPDGTSIPRIIPDPFTIELLDNWYLQRLGDIKYVDDLTSDLKILYNYPGNRPRVPAAVAGMSFGGAAAAGAIIAYPGLWKGGFNFDGAHWNNSISGDTGKPFLLIGPPERTPEGDTSWESFKAAQSAWVKELHIPGIEHHAFTDAAAWAGELGWSQALKEEQIGTADGERVIKVYRALTKNFLDWILRGGSGSLVKAPSLAFPEVVHIP